MTFNLDVKVKLLTLSMCNAYIFRKCKCFFLFGTLVLYVYDKKVLISGMTTKVKVMMPYHVRY